jgi:hypothetical protein
VLVTLERSAFAQRILVALDADAITNHRAQHRKKDHAGDTPCRSNQGYPDTAYKRPEPNSDKGAKSCPLHLMTT